MRNNMTPNIELSGSRTPIESVHNGGCPLSEKRLRDEIEILENHNWKQLGFDFPEQRIFEIEIRKQKISQQKNNQNQTNHGTEE